MASIDKRPLKAYVRFDGTGRIVPSSLILRRKMPKVGKWAEIPAFECCNPTTSNILTFRVRINEDQDFSNTFFMYMNDFGTSSTGKINWGDGVVESFSTEFNASHNYPRPGYYLVTMEFTTLSKINAIVLGNGQNKYSNHSGRVTWITGLDIFNTEGISNLILIGNDLTSIVLPEIALDNLGNPGYVDLAANDMRSLVVNNSVAIDAIDLYKSQFLESLVINAPDLTNDVYWFNTSLSSFDFYNFPSIPSIDISGSKFTSLDVHHLVNLYSVYANNNQLTSIDVSDCIVLDTLYLNNNALPEAQVNNLLITLDNLGLIDGFIDVAGGTNAFPTGAALAAITSLEGKGWTVVTNINEGSILFTITVDDDDFLPFNLQVANDGGPDVVVTLIPGDGSSPVTNNIPPNQSWPDTYNYLLGGTYSGSVYIYGPERIRQFTLGND